MRQHGGDIRIVQDQHIRRHTEGARVAGSGRRKSAVQHRMHQVGGLGHDDGAVARQGRIGARHAFAALAVAARAMVFVQPGAALDARGACWLGGGLRGRFGIGHLRQRLQVGCHGLEVGITLVLRALEHHLGHRTTGVAAGRLPGLEKGDDLGQRPVGHAGLGPVVQRGGVPFLQRKLPTAGATGLERAQRVARTVAFGAMGQALHKVGAAVPLGGLRRVGRLHAGAEIQRTPKRQRCLRAEGPAQCRLAIRLGDGGLAHQPGVQGV